tara:strand:- start:1900 stop:2391 length:492 start_codon:yes stop_codon:yes gene_type:complete
MTDKISKNISYKESIHSQTAKRKGIKNEPNEEQLANMFTIAEMIFQPLRAWVGGPIKINSFFRSPELNAAIGGAYKIKNGKKVQTSQHCKGQAMDLDDVYGHKTNAEMYMYIKENLDFDQLIWEFGDDENPNWIHVSYVDAQQNRNRCLKAYKDNGRTKYAII